MTWGRRRTTAPAVLLASVVGLSGCGGGTPSGPEPTPVVIPGSTVTIGTETGVPLATQTPTEATSSAAPVAATYTTITELVDRVVVGLTTDETVNITIGSDTGAPVVDADHQYLPAGSNDYSATVTVDGLAYELRRVDGTTYARTGDAAWVSGADLPSDVASYARWNVLEDLKAVLGGARDFTGSTSSVEVDGTALETYTYTVDAAALADVTQAPAGATGDVAVTFAIDTTGRPVRVDETFSDGTVLRTEYRSYGEPVAVAVPPIG